MTAQTDWQHLKSAPLTTAAADASAAKLVAALRAMIAHVGVLSQLGLDSDPDIHPLAELTLVALPQIQQRLGNLTLQMGDCLRADTAGARQSRIADRAARLLADDLERITRASRMGLSNAPEVDAGSVALPKELSPAVEQCTAANQAFLGLLNRVAAGEAVPVAEVEAAGWKAHAESFRLWETSAGELDTLLARRVLTLRHSQRAGLAGLAAILALITAGCWFLWITS